MSRKNIEGNVSESGVVSSIFDHMERSKATKPATNESQTSEGHLSHMDDYRNRNQDEERSKRDMRRARKAGKAIMERQDKEFF